MPSPAAPKPAILFRAPPTGGERRFGPRPAASDRRQQDRGSKSKRRSRGRGGKEDEKKTEKKEKQKGIEDPSVAAPLSCRLALPAIRARSFSAEEQDSSRLPGQNGHEQQAEHGVERAQASDMSSPV
ncbi:hypothetical protein CDD83_2528 [Cordyceps sp. RAO-2017]|nr:hypothetical protein CDD83_2528 [Cordyceps sp. RAO-2017]